MTVTAVKPVGGQWGYTTADTVIAATDTVLVSGTTAKAEAFSQLR